MPWSSWRAIVEGQMPNSLRELEKPYGTSLKTFLENESEQALAKAYSIGRKAIDGGFGVLDFVNVHQRAVIGILEDTPPKRIADTIERSMVFFRESLSPFEMSLRGFRENNDRLRQSLNQLRGTQKELQRQNEELTVARQRYLEQFDFAPDGYLVTDLTGVVEEANIAAAVLLHSEREMMAGKPLVVFLPSDDQDRFAAHLLQLQSGSVHRIRDWQTTIRPLSGRPFPAALTVGVVRNNEGKPAGLRWLLRDVTNFKRAESERADLLVRERVARAEATASRRLGFLSEASRLLTASLDSEATLLSVARLSVPFLADWCLIYILDDNGSTRRVAVAQADTSKGDLAHNLGLHHSPDIPMWISETLEGGHARTFPEITPALLASLAVNEEHFQTIQAMEARSAMVVPLTARGRTLGVIVLVSAESERSFHEADQELAEDLARRCAYAVDNARLYSEVIVQRDKAEKASRVKDEFLAILSHELRNPLVPILGWSRILKTRAVITDDVLNEGILSLERNAHNIQRLVDDCLELVRTSTRTIRLALEQVDANQIVAASIEAIVPLAREKGLKLDLELAHEPLWVLGDRTRLEQVVVNLLTNAVKYTPSGSIQIRSAVSGNEAIISVRDTGVGIAPDFIEKVFEPFRQASSAWLTSESGLGIGLSIAHEIVRLHAGKIWAESEGLHRGSLFSVSLPHSSGSGEAQSIDAATPISHRSTPRKLRLLVVEDSSDVLLLIRQELEWNGYQVYVAKNGSVAFEIAKRELPDLIISDIKMPEIDGYQLIRMVREVPELAKVPAIAMTGFGMERDIEMAKSVGYSAHLVKPIDMDQMNQLIQQLTA
jgi:PAS domain S-box-containing protein